MPDDADLDAEARALDRGWVWMQYNEAHRKFPEFEQRWLDRLAQYESLVPQPRENDCAHEHSDGVAGVGPRDGVGTFWRCVGCGQIWRYVPDKNGTVDYGDGLRVRKQIWGYSA